MIGRTLSHYAIEERLGAGGMGAVYRARDLALGRDVALKVVADELDPMLRERLLREAEAGARLQHPVIATFFEAGATDGVAFIAMELIAHVRGRPRTLGGGFLMVQALAGLTRATGEAEPLEQALRLVRERTGLSFDLLWTCDEETTLVEMGRAALALGRRDGRAFLEEARRAASFEATQLLESMPAGA